MWTTPGGARARRYRGGMRMRVGALALLGMLTLSGCGGGTPIPTLPPTPTATPVFASEEEALAAAEEAYAAYSEMSDLISSQGGVDPERIAAFVTERRLVDELRGFETLRDSGLRLEGKASVTAVELQRYDEVAGEVEIAFYGCVDFSGSRVLNSAGEDVTPVDREDVLLLEIVLRAPANGDRLLLESDDPWAVGGC